MDQLVTFLTVPATAISYTARASGEALSYKMVIGITVGEESVRFKHPDYEIEVGPEAVEIQYPIMMPGPMATRLMTFANTHFTQYGSDYDGGDFAAYVAGFQATLQHQSSRGLRSVEVDDIVKEMALYFIGTETGKVLHAFIGLEGRHALSVPGRREKLGISQVDDLMRVYGGTILGQVLDPRE